jgi:hypothetical protein
MVYQRLQNKLLFCPKKAISSLSSFLSEIFFFFCILILKIYLASFFQANAFAVDKLSNCITALNVTKKKERKIRKEETKKNVKINKAKNRKITWEVEKE